MTSELFHRGKTVLNHPSMQFIIFHLGNLVLLVYMLERIINMKRISEHTFKQHKRPVCFSVSMDQYVVNMWRNLEIGVPIGVQ